ncbi:hypothetical protein FRC07_006409 [Ceratobasidium sp. 392]|nr:hypothetical protein FRC07_006409 [Ceratobasidium sp. 392]
MSNPSDAFVPRSSDFSGGTEHPIMTALNEWKTAHTLMSNTILSYLAACATLRASYATPIRQPSELSTIKEATRAVSSELKLLALEEAALRTMRISLAESVNNSATIAPANRLPPEVLSRIFVLSRTCCVRDVGYQMNGFADVCTYWRRTALDMAHLWTHVDVGPNISGGLTKLLLYRSKKMPVHVHIIEPGEAKGEEEEENDNEPEPDEHVCAYQVNGIMTTLVLEIQYMGWIYAFHLRCI